MSSSLTTQIKAEAMLPLLASVTGQTPQIDYSGGNARIYWTDDQILALQGELNAQIDKQLSSALAPAPTTEPEIVIDWGPVVVPVLSSRAVPVVLGTAAAIGGLGFLLGRLTKRGRR